MRTSIMLIAGSLLFSCNLIPEVDPRNCDLRDDFYFDSDGDGWGDLELVYIGCEAPSDQWVTQFIWTTDTGDTGDSDSDTSVDTDWEDTDTDWEDTDTDTDVPE